MSFKELFKIKFIRTTLVLSFLMLLTFPLYDVFIAYPSFSNALTDEAVDDAIIAARHLMSELHLEGKKWTRESVAENDEILHAVKEDFKLPKIKVFSAAGENIFTTDPADVKGIEQKKEFIELISKGKIYAMSKTKNQKSVEGHTLSVDVVEVYVPHMEEGVFKGTFEIYYDITRAKKRLDKIRYDATMLVVLIASGLFSLIFATSYKAGKAMTAHNSTVEKLERTQFSVDKAADSIFWISPQGAFLDVNDAAVSALGYTREELLKKWVFDIDFSLKQKDWPAHWDELKTKKSFTFQSKHTRKDGTSHPVEITVNYLMYGGMEYNCTFARDISERKKSDELIQYQLKRLNMLYSIDKAVTSSLDLRATLNLLIEQILTQLDIDASAVLLMNDSTKELEYVASKGFHTPVLKHNVIKLGECGAGQAALNRETVILEDIKTDPGCFERAEFFSVDAFTTYIAVPLIVKNEVKGILELFSRVQLTTGAEELDFLETIADQAAIAIDNATLFNHLQRSNIELILAYDSTIVGWSRVMDMRDKETEGHSRRVTDMTMRIAKDMGLSDEDIMHVRRGALLHDIGKMAIPDNVLLKPGGLNEDELKIMREHPHYAYKMLRDIDYLKRAADIPFCHHEKWDGSGYPKGLAGKEIPISARIFSIVDVWDALSSDRPYRAAWPKEKVDEYIRTQSGQHFDPEVVDIFFRILGKS